MRHACWEQATVSFRYEGSPCVVKVFDLHTHRGLPGFIQEVMLHVRQGLKPYTLIHIEKFSISIIHICEPPPKPILWPGPWGEGLLVGCVGDARCVRSVQDTKISKIRVVFLACFPFLLVVFSIIVISSWLFGSTTVAGLKPFSKSIQCAVILTSFAILPTYPLLGNYTYIIYHIYIPTISLFWVLYGVIQ